MDTLKSAVNSVLNAISPHEQPSISRAEVIVLEEQERQRRVEHASQSQLDQQNARKIASIVKTLSFPVLNSTNAGFKAYTNRCEERERKRRLENRVEYELRKLNALKVSGIIIGLGWPFIRANWQGTEYIFPDETAQQEELERKRRLNNPLLAKMAKQNAASVAGIARWAHFKKNPLAGSKRRTRTLEERERKRRLLSTQEQEQACENGYAVARCIRNLGYPFFVQGKEARAGMGEVRDIEEKERARRLRDRSEQSLAREQAHAVSSLLPTTDVSALEDKERDRRLLDFQGQQLARENASKISGLFSASNVDLLEKNERERRLNAPEEQALAKQTAFKVSRLISLRKRGAKFAQLERLESTERERRLATPMEQMYARQNATKVSGLVSQAGFQKGSSFSKLRGPSVVGIRKATSDVESLEAQERARRLADAQEQNLARQVAQNVSDLLKDQMPFTTTDTLAIENYERERRLQDTQGQNLARANALKVSGLVRQAYWKDTQKSLAASDIELGFYSMSVTSQQIPSGNVLPSKDRNLLSQQRSFGTSATPSYGYANTVTYAPSAPAISTTTYIMPSTVPILTTPIAAVPPVTRGLATVHSDRERKVLTKEANKHAKLATKESKKAEQKALKAEQLHGKGKDARAAKYEATAEQHALAAKHHQQWANEAGLLAKSATDPSLITTTTAPVHRPAM